MALFTDTEPDPPERRRGSRTIAWLILVVAVLGIVVVATIPAPYVIEQPGPVYNTLGTAESESGVAPLISIPAAKTYPTRGSLDMLTVTVSGDREQPPSWAEIATAWLDPSQAVVPIDEIYPAGETVEQSNEAGRVDMVNSQQDAIAAALRSLDYTFMSTLTVAQTEKGFPAAAVLKKGDIVQTVNGKTFPDVDSLRAEVARNGTNDAATVVYSRGGKSATAKITPVQSGGTESAPVLGVTIASSYSFPIQVKIQLDNVGGPSAGMMFALGIIDKLTPGALNGGKNVAGTGTISSDGAVGPIGGIRQKMYGAVKAGASYFLAPKSNCNEVTGHVPGGLTVFAVSTLDDSLAALKAISSGSGASALPACPTS